MPEHGGPSRLHEVESRTAGSRARERGAGASHGCVSVRLNHPQAASPSPQPAAPGSPEDSNLLQISKEHFGHYPHSEDAAGMSRLGAVSGPKRVPGSSKPFCSKEELDMSTLSVLSNLPTLQSERGLSRYLAAV